MSAALPHQEEGEWVGEKEHVLELPSSGTVPASWAPRNAAVAHQRSQCCSYSPGNPCTTQPLVPLLWFGGCDSLNASRPQTLVRLNRPAQKPCDDHEQSGRVQMHGGHRAEADDKAEKSSNVIIFCPYPCCLRCFRHNCFYILPAPAWPNLTCWAPHYL